MKPWETILVVTALITGFPLGWPNEQAFSREAELRPVASLRIQNPQDSSDVRTFWRFELPPDVQVDRLTTASLRLPAIGHDDVPLVLARAEGVWSGQTTWSAAVQAMPGLMSASFQPAWMQVAGNRVEEENGLLVSTGYEFNLRAEVSDWLESGVNYGVWIGRVPGTDDDLRLVVPGVGSDAHPTLVVIFDGAP